MEVSGYVHASIIIIIIIIIIITDERRFKFCIFLPKESIHNYLYWPYIIQTSVKCLCAWHFTGGAVCLVWCAAQSYSL
jgi:hypothetical protein